MQEWTILYNELKTKKNPDTDALRKFLEAPYEKVCHACRKSIITPMEHCEVKTGSPHTRTDTNRNDDAVTIVLDRIVPLLGVGYAAERHYRSAVSWLKRYRTDRQILNMFDGIIDFNEKS